MLISIFKKASPLQFILVFAFSLALWIQALSSPEPPHCAHVMSVLCPWIISFTEIFGGIPAVLTAYLILIISGFLLTFSLSSNHLISRQTFFPALILPLFASYTPALLSFHPVIPSILLLTAALYYLLHAYEKAEQTREMFSAAFLISLASLFHLPILPFALLPWLSLLTYRVFDWRQWTVVLIGLITPFIFLLSITYFIEGAEYIREYSRQINPLIGLPDFVFSWELIVFWGATLLVLIRSLGSILWHANEKVISYRKKHIVVLWFMILSQVGLPISGNAYIYHSILIFIPLSFYATYIFIERGSKRQWVHQLILSLYLLTLVLMNIFSGDAFTYSS